MGWLVKGWSNLADAIAGERGAIGELLAKVDHELARLGFKTGGDYADCVAFFVEMGKLIALLRTEFRWPANDLEFFKRERLGDRSEGFARILADAATVAEGTKDSDVLLFDPDDLIMVAGHIERCAELIMKAEDYAESKLQHLSGEGDPDAIEAEIVDELTRLSDDKLVTP